MVWYVLFDTETALNMLRIWNDGVRKFSLPDSRIIHFTSFFFRSDDELEQLTISLKDLGDDSTTLEKFHLDDLNEL
jgi:hypothetical protein